MSRADVQVTELVNSPLSLVGTFTLTTVLAGGTLRDAQDKIRADAPRTWVRSCCFWPPFIAVNMKLVPVQYQASVGGLAWAVWAVILAYMANLRVHREDRLDAMSGAHAGHVVQLS